MDATASGLVTRCKSQLRVSFPPVRPSAVLVSVAAQPNPNKAPASVKQGALHKKVMSAGGGDRRRSVRVAAHMPGCVDVVYVCHSGSVSINTQVSVGFEVISWEPLDSAGARPEETGASTSLDINSPPVCC